MSLQAVYVDACLQLLQFPLMREMKKDTAVVTTDYTVTVTEKKEAHCLCLG